MGYVKGNFKKNCSPGPEDVIYPNKYHHSDYLCAPNANKYSEMRWGDRDCQSFVIRSWSWLIFSWIWRLIFFVNDWRNDRRYLRSDRKSQEFQKLIENDRDSRYSQMIVLAHIKRYPSHLCKYLRSTFGLMYCTDVLYIWNSHS